MRHRFPLSLSIARPTFPHLGASLFDLCLNVLQVFFTCVNLKTFLALSVKAYVPAPTKSSILSSTNPKNHSLPAAGSDKTKCTPKCSFNLTLYYVYGPGTAFCDTTENALS